MQNGLKSKMLFSIEDYTISCLAVILQECCPCLDFIIIQRIKGDSRVSGRICCVARAKFESYYFLTTQVAKEKKKTCYYRLCTTLLMRAASAMLVACVFYVVGISVPAVSHSTVICISKIWCCTLHTLSYVRCKKRQPFCFSVRSMSLKP